MPAKQTTAVARTKLATSHQSKRAADPAHATVKLIVRLLMEVTPIAIAFLNG